MRNKYMVDELEGSYLDEAVAAAICQDMLTPGIDVQPETLKGMKSGNWTPSISWDQAGPIIQREAISIQCTDASFPESDRYWMAIHPRGANLPSLGRTPLIAAMRVYVASRFGESIEIDPN